MDDEGFVYIRDRRKSFVCYSPEGEGLYDRKRHNHPGRRERKSFFRSGTAFLLLQRSAKRKDDRLTRQITSSEVENALYADRRVSEAVAIGIPDSILGELVGAIVVIRDGQEATEADLLTGVKSRSV